MILQLLLKSIDISQQEIYTIIRLEKNKKTKTKTKTKTKKQEANPEKLDLYQATIIFIGFGPQVMLAYTSKKGKRQANYRFLITKNTTIYK